MTKMHKIIIKDKTNGITTETNWILVKEEFDTIYKVVSKPSVFGSERFEITVKEANAVCINCLCFSCKDKKSYCCDCDICDKGDCLVWYCNKHKEEN